MAARAWDASLAGFCSSAAEPAPCRGSFRCLVIEGEGDGADELHPHCGPIKTKLPIAAQVNSVSLSFMFTSRPLDPMEAQRVWPQKQFPRVDICLCFARPRRVCCSIRHSGPGHAGIECIPERETDTSISLPPNSSRRGYRSPFDPNIDHRQSLRQQERRGVRQRRFSYSPAAGCGCPW